MGKRTAVAVAALLMCVGGNSLAAQQPKTPVLTVQDHIEIEQLDAKYYQTLDRGDSEGYASVFTPDGAFNQTRGTEALKEFAKNFGAGPTGAPVRHWMSNLLLTPVPGGVEGKVYVIQFNIRNTPITAATYSRYDDLLVKTPAGWRFKEKNRSSDTTIGTGRGRGGAPAAPGASAAPDAPSTPGTAGGQR